MDRQPGPLDIQSADEPPSGWVALDAAAMVFVLSRGCSVPARVVELGLDGCQVVSEFQLSAGPVGRVEIAFKVNGVAIRLTGIARDVGHHETIIRFGEMAERRRAQLLELIEEVGAKLAGEAARQAANAAAVIQQQGHADLAPPPAHAVPTQHPSRASDSIEEDSSHRLEAASSMQPPAKPLSNLPVTIPEVAAVRVWPGSNSSAGVSQKPSVSQDQPHPRFSLGHVINTNDRHLQIAAVPVKQERRMHARHTVDTQASIYLVNVSSRLSGRILNVSMTGCRIRTDDPFPVGIYRRCEAEFVLDGLPFRLAGVTQAIIDRYTVGIRFLDLSQRKEEHLSELIAEIEELRGEGNF